MGFEVCLPTWEGKACTGGKKAQEWRVCHAKKKTAHERRAKMQKRDAGNTVYEALEGWTGEGWTTGRESARCSTPAFPILGLCTGSVNSMVDVLLCMREITG